MTAFIKLMSMLENGFLLNEGNQDCHQNSYPLFNAGHYAGAFVVVQLLYFNICSHLILESFIFFFRFLISQPKYMLWVLKRMF